MTKSEEPPAARPEPDFVVLRHGEIREDNWEEYQALGFGVLLSQEDPDTLALALSSCRACYGIEHVYTGHAYDAEAGRPLRHKPGTGIYGDANAMEYDRQLRDSWERRQAEGGPATN